MAILPSSSKQMRTLSLLLLAVSLAMPASLTMTTSCTSLNGTVTGAGNCSIGDGVGWASAQASGTLSLSGNTLTVNASASAAAVPGILSPGTPAQEPFSASATVTISEDLYTNGPLRNGYIEITNLPGASEGGQGAASLSYALGSSFNFGCSLTSCLNGPFTEVVPIELGTNFTLTGTLYADGQGSDSFDGEGDGDVTSQETFQFFDANGTAINVYDPPSAVAPEPGSWGLLTFGVFFILLCGRGDARY